MLIVNKYVTSEELSKVRIKVNYLSNKALAAANFKPLKINLARIRPKELMLILI